MVTNNSLLHFFIRFFLIGSWAFWEILAGSLQNMVFRDLDDVASTTWSQDLRSGPKKNI